VFRIHAIPRPAPRRAARDKARPRAFKKRRNDTVKYEVNGF
jgi:hypothetical protein